MTRAVYDAVGGYTEVDVAEDLHFFYAHLDRVMGLADVPLFKVGLFALKVLLVNVESTKS